jgi:hypothetical protein
MTFLPILERELRVRARSRGTYWSRFAVALVGLLVWLPQLMWSGPLGFLGAMGPALLNAVVSAAFVVSCAACLLTADVISSERREGTLGLLLLTRVRAFDVLVGKLGSAGLTSLCALVAFLPMLMIPVLAGGVTGGEVFRKGLVLPDALFLALAAGLWASVRGYDWLKCARTAFLLLAGIVLVPSLLASLSARFWPPGPAIGLLSPLTALVSASDASYKASPGHYLISLFLVQATAWTLVVSAGFRLKSGWGEERAETSAAAPAVEDAGAEPVRPSRRFVGDDANAIAWLLQRHRGTRAILWAGALVGPIQYALYALLLRFVGTNAYATLGWPLGLVLSAFGSAMFAWAASRFFVETRRTGELELLLTTPRGARELVSAQWGVLKRLLRWPMLVMLAPVVLQAGFVVVRMGGFGFGPSNPFWLPYSTSTLMSCVNTLFGVGALCWVGMWFGLRAGGQARAAVGTICLVKGLPTFIGIACFFAISALGRIWGGWAPSRYWIMLCLPEVLDLLLYIALIRLARRRLLDGLALREPVRFDLRQTFSATVRDAQAVLRKARHWTPP